MFAVDVDGAGAIWLAGEAGVWRGGPGGWQYVDVPLPRVMALAVQGDVAAAGGATGGIVRSADGGRSWSAAYLDDAESPITCIVASPRFDSDRCLLAGSDGAGVLRSTDGGRSWRLAGAGLQEFSVLALAIAPAWGEREPALALTAGGLYRSPNGGRYWQRALDCGDDLPLTAIVFADARTAYAAGEGAGLLRSDDAGRTWAPLPEAGPSEVNCLWASDDLLLAGTAGGEIWASRDRGASWARPAAGHGSIMALGKAGDRLLAGAADDGLLLADDAGAGWAADPTLAARDLARLAVGPGGAPLAYGPTGGIWLGAGGWRRLDTPGSLPPLTCLAAGPAGLLLGTVAGLLTPTPTGMRPVGALGGLVTTALAARGAELWAGTAGGQIWRGSGDDWQPAGELGAGQTVTLLAFAGADPVAASSDGRRATLWRAGPGGWERWLTAEGDATRAALLAGERAWVALAGRLWRLAGDTWQEEDLAGPIVALDRAADGAPLAAAPDAIYRHDGAGWARLPIDLPPGGVLDLARGLALGRGGRWTVAG